MEWRKVKGFEEHYEVREDGLIRRLPISYYGKSPDGKDIVKRKGVFYPKQRVDRKGYLNVDLCLMEKGKKTARRVHRLVAEAFICGFNKSLTVDHLDCNKQNNHYSNLEFVTNAENLRRSHSYGTHSKVVPQKAKRKVDAATAAEIRRLNLLNDPSTIGRNLSKDYCQRTLARMFKVAQPTIRAVINYTGTYQDDRV